MPAPKVAPFNPARLSVRVLDPLGHPVAKASVGGMGLLLVEKDGAYVKRRVLPGHYEVSARDEKGNPIGKQTIDLAAGDERTLEFRQAGYGSLRLALTNLDAQDSLSTTVRLYPGVVTMPTAFSDLSPGGRTSYVPSAGTGDRFPKLPIGKYTLVVARRLQRNQVAIFREQFEIRVNEERVLTRALPDELPTVPSFPSKP